MTPTFASLSLAHLRTLDCLLQLKNLSHAAERLGCSQSALSRQLAHLRDAFGDPLLVRQGRGYVLSEHAETLVEPLRQVLDELSALRQPAAFDPARCERRFCIAASDYVAEHILPDLVTALEHEAPGVSLEYRTWQAGQYASLASGEVDLATTLFDESPPNLHGRLLGEDRAVCLMAGGHPLAACTTISQDDYLAYRHVRVSGGGDKDSFIDRHLRAQGLQRRMQLQVPFFSAMVQVIGNGQALATVPEHIARQLCRLHGLAWRPLGFIEHSQRYWVVWHQRLQASAEHRWLRNRVFELWRQSSFGVQGGDARLR
ncbi:MULTISPECIES: LysR family transcriptional regulator [Pseudomonas]|uniref:LysR family transcriptional regulator n=1 Tax=Pseudomonas TaxID=286 RepID=UPI0006D43A5C|nr:MULTISPECIES: LysR family transcriptional regulator [Pseudomonas]MBH3460410.1 LysR family transcriptional regulator [Pseudomonas putida]MBK0059851.1 LysR family transcriptional regulator [Pseudomonas sp. S44]OCT29544.1 LysR family transcriptional regulator [Pseudomonas putida]OCT31240.1 LysR family transcriptional regulator [Pseudomonas putida]OCT33482.1 LysR family transcriptional regulator [Pseudomonas putida]